MIGEYIFGKLADSEIEKVKQWLNENKAQKILLKCFSDSCENNQGICCVDKEAILSVDSNKIRPNLRPEQIMEGIKDVFEKCIHTDDTYKRESIKLEIVYNYLKEANKDLLELCHIDEDIHIVQDEVLENRKVIERHHSEVSKKFQELQAALRNDTLPILNFIDELNNSRMYCYIVLKVDTEVDEDFLAEIMPEAECSQYQDEKSGLWYIDMNFLEPICQSLLRSYLKELDDEFSENNIRIFGILTHQ